MDKQFYSQFGEDARLAEIFAGKASGFCLELGALDGVKDSTTLYFEKTGWKCVLVEANPELADKAKLNRQGPVYSCAAGRAPGSIEFLVARGAEYLSTMISTNDHVSKIQQGGATIERVQVPVMRLDDILQEANVTNLDFATIDVEGAELEVLLGFDVQKWKPRVLVLEDNSAGHDTRVLRHLKSKGYRCFLNDGLNDWYARRDDAELLTPARRAAQFRRRVRKRCYEWTVGWLPLSLQAKLVATKRKWFGKL